MKSLIILFVLSASSLSVCQNATSNDPSAGVSGPQQPTSAYVPVQKFDSKRDPAPDIQAAIAVAQRTGKRIMLDVGGDWCQFCRQLDEFFAEHRTLAELRDRSFVTVAVYYGDDNKNQQTLSHYSKVLGIPHFYVLEKDGTLLHSQHVIELRTGGKYDPEKMKDFLLKWAPAQTANELPISAPTHRQ